MKKLILVNTDEHGYFTKNRYIVERSFDPDKRTKSKTVLFYEGDKITVQVVKTIADYEMFIVDNYKHTIQMSSYLCFTKVKEKMFEIVRKIDDCEIFGFIPNANIENLEYYSNETLIEKHGLARIC